MTRHRLLAKYCALATGAAACSVVPVRSSCLIVYTLPRPRRRRWNERGPAAAETETVYCQLSPRANLLGGLRCVILRACGDGVRGLQQKRTRRRQRQRQRWFVSFWMGWRVHEVVYKLARDDVRFLRSWDRHRRDAAARRRRVRPRIDVRQVNDLAERW